MADLARIIARAQRRGDAPISTALLRAGSFSVALLCLPWLGEQSATLVVRSAREALTLAENMASAPDARALLFARSSHFVVDALLTATLPLTCMLALVAVLLGLLQGRGIWRWPTVRKQGGLRGPGVIGLSVGVVLWFSFLGIIGARLDVWSESLSTARPSDDFWALIAQLSWTVAGVTLLGSLFDAGWVQLSWRRRNTLPSWEERREQRQREVAPELRSAQRQRSRELFGL